MSINSGGGEKHIQLVKLTTHYIIETFNVNRMEIGYEERGLDVEIKMRTGFGGSGYTNANFSFRPDIVLCPFKKREDNLFFSEKEWEKLEDSTWIIFEAETNPRNIFKNILKIEAYKKIKANDNFGREAYSFVLVVFDDQRKFLEKRGIEPFDEAWLFDVEGQRPEPTIIGRDTI